MDLLQECLDASAALLRSLPCCTQLLLYSLPGALPFLQSESHTKNLDLGHPKALPQNSIAIALTIASYVKRSVMLIALLLPSLHGS